MCLKERDSYIDTHIATKQGNRKGINSRGLMGVEESIRVISLTQSQEEIASCYKTYCFDCII